MNEERYNELAELLEQALDSFVEYETEHEDAGGDYAHLPREGGWAYHNGDDRLRGFLATHEIETTPAEFEELVEAVLDDCDYKPGHIFSCVPHGEFQIASYPVGEVEDQYSFPDLCRVLDIEPDECREFVDLAMKDNRFCLRPNGDGGVLSYTNTDAVWIYYVSRSWIEERVGWMREAWLEDWRFDEETGTLEHPCGCLTSSFRREGRGWVVLGWAAALDPVTERALVRKVNS